MITFRRNVITTALSRLGASPTTCQDMDFIRKVTENRISTCHGGKKGSYGYCGDFVTSTLFDAGSRDPSLNRVAVNGSWRPGENLTMLSNRAIAISAAKKWRPGDVAILQRPNGDHGTILLGAFRKGDKTVNSKAIDALMGHMDKRNQIVDSSLFLTKNGQMTPLLKLILDNSDFGYDFSTIEQSGTQAYFITIDGNGPWGNVAVNRRAAGDHIRHWCPVDQFQDLMPTPPDYSAPHVPERTEPDKPAKGGWYRTTYPDTIGGVIMDCITDGCIAGD